MNMSCNLREYKKKIISADSDELKLDKLTRIRR